MKQAQYLIENLENGLVTRLGELIVLFDSQEEAEEFINKFPDFFENANFKLTNGIYFINNSINYKDITKEMFDRIEIKK